MNDFDDKIIALKIINHKFLNREFLITQDEKRFYTVMWKEKSQTYWKPTPTYARGQAGISIKVNKSFYNI